jgi:hypothetical protein
MMVIDCRDIGPLLEPYADAELSPLLADVIAAHVSVCAGCRARLDALARVQASIAAWAQGDVAGTDPVYLGTLARSLHRLAGREATADSRRSAGALVTAGRVARQLSQGLASGALLAARTAAWAAQRVAGAFAPRAGGAGVVRRRSESPALWAGRASGRAGIIAMRWLGRGARSLARRGVPALG